MRRQYIKSGYAEGSNIFCILLPAFSIKGMSNEIYQKLVEESRKEIKNPDAKDEGPEKKDAYMLYQRCTLADQAFKKLGSRMVVQDRKLVATDNEMAKYIAKYAKQKGHFTLPLHGLQKLTVDPQKPEARFGFLHFLFFSII